MPYYHKKCGGEISIFRCKCKKCGHKWPLRTLFLYPLPKDISRFIIPTKQPATYAKWGNRIPGVPVIASMLPNWPRWARILSTTILFLLLALLIVYLVRGI